MNGYRCVFYCSSDAFASALSLIENYLDGYIRPLVIVSSACNVHEIQVFCDAQTSSVDLVELLAPLRILATISGLPC